MKLKKIKRYISLLPINEADKSFLVEMIIEYGEEKFNDGLIEESYSDREYPYEY